MNKRIKSFLCVALLLFSIQNIQTNSLSAFSSTFSSVAQASVFEQLPKLICDHPLVSTVIAVIISIAGYKKIFYFKNNTIASSPNSQENYHPNITITKNDDQDEFVITLINNENKKYEYPNIHSFKLSPRNKYLLLCQCEDIPATQLVGQVLFKERGVSSLIKDSIRTIPVIKLVNTQTGEIIQSFRNSHCVFNKDEDVLLIQEPKNISRLQRFTNQLRKLIHLSTEKEIPADRREFVDMLQYRLFHIPSKKDIGTFENLRSASLSNKNNLIIIDENNSIKKHKPKNSFSFANKFYFFSAPFYYCANNTVIKTNSLPYTTEYFFDHTNKFYSLRITNKDKQILTINNVINHTCSEKYILINKKYTNNNPVLINTLQNLIGPHAKQINNFIEALNSSEYITHLVNIETGEIIANFEYKTPLFCSFVPNKEEIVIIDRETLNYILFDIATKTSHILKDAHAISFDQNTSFIILDSQQTPCLPSPSLIEQVTTTGMDMIENLKSVSVNLKNILPQPTIKIPTKHNTIMLIGDLAYDQFLYVGEKNHLAIKPSVKKLLKQGIYGFEWNIHQFKQTSSNFLKRNHATNPTLCIFNNTISTDSTIQTINSLQSAFYSLLNVIKKSENHRAILTLFLHSNILDAQRIDTEIKQVLTKHGYTDKTPLLRPQKITQWPTLATMLQEQKYLVVFNSTDHDTRYTFSKKRANLNLIGYFAENASNNPDLFVQANEANKNYMQAMLASQSS